MSSELWILMLTAASLGTVHTLLGPDHYLPFVAMAKARGWSPPRTIGITLACGLGHVASSIVLGSIGIALGVGLGQLEGIEATRGDWAAWAFLLFGSAYLLWAIWKLSTNKHSHIHEAPKNRSLTPWVLFLIFVLGPCEPLIPLLMFPAAQHSLAGIIAVSSVFAISTLVTMVAAVLTLHYGTSLLKVNHLHKYTHAIAGGTVTLSGALILLGL